MQITKMQVFLPTRVTGFFFFFDVSASRIFARTAVTKTAAMPTAMGTN